MGNEYTDKIGLLEHMDQDDANKYAEFFNSFSKGEYMDFRNKWKSRPKYGGGKITMKEYLDNLKDAVRIYKEEEERRLAMQEEARVRATLSYPSKVKIYANEKIAKVTSLASFSDGYEEQKVTLDYHIEKKEGDWFFLEVVDNQTIERNDGLRITLNNEHKIKYNKDTKRCENVR